MAFSSEHRSWTTISLPPSPALRTHRRHSRSNSCSKPYLNEGQPDIEPNDENGLPGTLRRKKSVTLDDCLSSEEVRQQLGLATQRHIRDSSGIVHESAQGEFLGHRQRHVSGLESVVDKIKHPKYLPTLETIVSVPSSRHPSQPPTPWGGPAAELVYHEDKNRSSRQVEASDGVVAESQSGTVRRRRRMRTVSKEDYLLVRGANPRTGRVTPGSHSVSGSFDGEGPEKVSGSSVGGKWRQRGDQWISLAVDQATPFDAPFEQARQPALGVHLRTPPKLAPGRHHHGRPQPDENLSRHNWKLPERDTQQLTVSGGSLPGSYPLTPQNDPAHTLSSSYTEPRVRRKPVGTVDRMVNERGRTVTGASLAGPPITLPFAQDQPRSSSAPTPKRQEYFSPEDIGRDHSKELPPLPQRTQEHRARHQSHPHHADPFLGPQAQPSVWIEDVPLSFMNNPRIAQKNLPDLPTNIGPYQYQQRRNSHQPAPRAMQGDRPRGPRGGDLTYPYVRIPRRRHQLNPWQGPQGQDTSGRTKPHPNNFRVGHPRVINLDGTAQGRPRGPRTMTQTFAQTRAPAERNVDMAPPNTTSMNTGTSIHTRIPTSHQQHVRPNTDQSRLVALPIPTSRTTASSFDASATMQPVDWGLTLRPRMPNRSDETSHVPKISSQRAFVAEQRGMENRHQWRIVGTNLNANEQNNGEGEGDQVSSIGYMPDQATSIGRLRQRRPGEVDTVMTRGMHPSNDVSMEGLNVRDDGPPVESVQRNGLTRECSRCYNGFVRSRNDGTRGIDGLTRTSDNRFGTHHAHEAPVDARALDAYSPSKLSQTTTFSSTQRDELLHRPLTPDVPLDQIVDIYGDGRDHGACCPQCCDMEDCHDGCLGHPSPVPSPARTSASGGDTSVGSGTTAVNDSSDELRYADKIAKSRVTFAKQTFRKQSSNVPPKKQSLPLPATLWGGDGSGSMFTGAVAAAKKALNPTPQPRSVNGAMGAAQMAMGLPKVPKENEIRVTKRRAAQQKSPNDPSTLAAAGANQGKRLASGTQPAAQSRSASRVVTGSRDTSADITNSKSRSRKASGASLRSIDIPSFRLPFFNAGEESLAVLCELIVLPFRVGWMWISQHPELRGYAWMAAEKMLEMLRVVAATVETCWAVAQVYSRTGRVRLKSSTGVPGLMWDIGRSVAFVGVFSLGFVVVGRVIGGIWWVVSGLGWCVRGSMWVLWRVVLGFG